MQPITKAVARYPWIPYVGPFALFMALTVAQPGEGFVPWLYPLKTLLVGASLLLLMKGFPPLNVRATGLAVAVGVAVFVLWVLPEGMYPLLGAPAVINPFDHLNAPWVYVWIGFRILGAGVVVAVMEELFWRGWVLRWIVHPNWQKVPMGTFTWPSFLLTSVLFAVEHHQWLVGLLAGVAYNLLLYRTKSLYACMVAHGVTNVALAAYVLATGEWGFW